ncbi:MULTISPECIES: hypothetical protein [unclassified Leptolyngbya]|uniref:hypothetical protein n=1 Tax=unclassified Leptolyngbya TaxID=2650499 RepID=UPI0016854C2D|nr:MULTISPECIES: hypothetical protein [unclassified Leptolyngbya]MBD1909442.1 hypothetical protein [Leptolyngbya sp. FACHB-8]MBD2155661.1 hypothetical protein [Leptolyngbya sp. FACHB-16]
MEERDVTDSQGTTWTCVQAYSGLSDDAAQVKGNENKYWVVCTPSGGAQSVRIQLENDWQHACSDETLLNQIATAQSD